MGGDGKHLIRRNAAPYGHILVCSIFIVGRGHGDGRRKRQHTDKKPAAASMWSRQGRAVFLAGIHDGTVFWELMTRSLATQGARMMLHQRPAWLPAHFHLPLHAQARITKLQRRHPKTAPSPLPSQWMDQCESRVRGSANEKNRRQSRPMRKPPRLPSPLLPWDQMDVWAACSRVRFANAYAHPAMRESKTPRHRMRAKILSWRMGDASPLLFAAKFPPPPQQAAYPIAAAGLRAIQGGRATTEVILQITT